ncbi:hypothetical protein D7Y15_20095 [Corallococcus sp. AB030]|uniref:hypothetical protein n=1 Tax=Corallococcus TaxID=83461 RepID=UPI000EA224E1|nr:MULTISPECIES: hypothetical protein [unclassified Corallococcus]RKH26890.1 hypothetical protein D7V77_13265 [Corallococcus sp. CA041A]RKI11537.1 hypothetical protein D7Y15_20095 [Corallococcus sp. AB030]RUO89281.1 hypothetical protein D7Y11_31030 [Corallococcus sp. AB018]
MRPARPSVFERIPTATRAWASRLVLLLACASVVATSRAQSEDVASPVHTGTPFRLTAETDKVTRTLVVRTSAKEKLSDPVEGELHIQAKAKWTPGAPTQTPQPSLAISFLDGELTYGGQSGVLEPDVAVTVENVAYFGGNCAQNQGCEWTVQVVFDVRSNSDSGTIEAPGTVDVEWTAQGFAHVLDDSSVPKGFTVSLSEP